MGSGASEVAKNLQALITPSGASGGSSTGGSVLIQHKLAEQLKQAGVDVEPVNLAAVLSVS